jgi:uncharacterized damage-inducible protein DinB
MTIADLLLQDFDFEVRNTRRTLERVPDQPEWVPHPKSMPIGKLAMHCATICQFGYYVIEDPGMDMAASTRPHLPLTWTTREDALARLTETSTRCRAAIAAATDEHLTQVWRFSFGEQLISEAPRTVTFRMMCFNHMIHHVAQLGVYLRLLDVPVPALYGPSADEPWNPK